MGLRAEPLWLIVSGRSERDVADRLTFAESRLAQAASNHWISSYLLPSAMWPRPDNQAANRSTAAALGRLGPTLRKAALDDGFNTNALVLTEQLVQTWARAGASTGVVWPTNEVSQWLLKKFVAKTPQDWLVMGLIYPATNTPAQDAPTTAHRSADIPVPASASDHRADKNVRALTPASALANLSAELAQHHAYLSGWELLGSTTLNRVRAKLWQLVAPMIVLVLASLWFAFRRSTEILLGGAVLLMSGLCLLAIMALVGWSWNLLNLMAFPLILGTGVDYTIFMQLALRRHGGDQQIVRRSIGRALLLCGGTAMAGFGSLAWSSYPGMASLGKVCAVGIGANMLISVFLLPAWWTAANRKALTRETG
jgi:uncharacterized protein